MSDNPLADILAKGQAAGLAEMTRSEKSARTWFRLQAQKVVNVNPSKLLTSNPMKLKRRVVPGYMYIFLYNAKTAAKLPYWDRFPLVFPIESYKDGFLGINFHYLSIVDRTKLMDALYGLAFSNRYDESVRLRISYSILKNATKYRNFRPCVKRYLDTHIQSDFFLIDWQEWPIALFLPTECFRKARKERVWAESHDMIHEYGIREE